MRKDVGQTKWVVVPTPPSVLGRLLQEISWEGNAKHYRNGGQGFENVLTAEVFQALDFLPRTEFLGRILRSASGGSPETLLRLASQIEDASFSLLPGDIFLEENPPKGQPQLYVQPDGILQSSDVYCLLEAKRIRRSAFQPEQLAREFLTVLQEAGEREPLLLLVLPEAPPVPVRAHGRMSLAEAIAQWLEPVLNRAEFDFPPAGELVDRIDSVVAYVTWSQVSRSVADGLEELRIADPSLAGCVARLVKSLQQAVEWHS